MSDNINSMNFKQLKNEVQSLRDELAIMKRKYEDIIYNLDDDNFSSRFVKEKGEMRTAIEINAEGIKTKVSNKEFESTKTQTAQKIESEVKKLSDADKELSSKITQTADTIRAEVKSATETLDGKFENYSTIEQTDNKISLKVKEAKEYAEGYVTDQLANGDYITNATFKTQFDIYADGIYSTVEANYNSLSGDIDDVWYYASSINQTANSISTRVGKVEDGEFNGYTLFTQTSDKFEFIGNVEIKSTDGSNNALKIGDGHLQLYPSGYTYSLVDLGMYKIGTNWEPRMRFGRGTDSSGTNGTGWIYKTTNGFGMMYNTAESDALTIEFNDYSNAIEIIGNVNFSGGTVTGLPAGGTGGTATAVFG